MPVHTYGYINIDVPLNGALSVLSRLAGAFAVHETSPLSMAVSIDAGALFVSGNVLEVAAQTSALISDFTCTVLNKYIVKDDDGGWP